MNVMWKQPTNRKKEITSFSLFLFREYLKPTVMGWVGRCFSSGGLKTLSKTGNPYVLIQGRLAFSCYRFKTCAAQLSSSQSFLQRPVVIIKTVILACFFFFLTCLFNTMIYLQYQTEQRRFREDPKDQKVNFLPRENLH